MKTTDGKDSTFISQKSWEAGESKEKTTIPTCQLGLQTSPLYCWHAWAVNQDSCA
jgi:hypothetical protein